MFLASLSPAPADFDADAVSAKFGGTFRVSNAVTLHAQYAGGFRAPPYTAINSGFTNLLGGYTSIPNTELDPETSDNVEGGIRVDDRPRQLRRDRLLESLRQLHPAGAARHQSRRPGSSSSSIRTLAKVRIRGVELQADARV